MTPYPIVLTLLIASISLVVLFLVLTALAGMVNVLIKYIPETRALSADQFAENLPKPAIDDGEALAQLAAVVGAALARARACGQPVLIWMPFTTETRSFCR
jgi:Na+-transporting methylmalonyl-CoA/oxaloacetate decarboxylase gamma subunit